MNIFVQVFLSLFTIIPLIVLTVYLLKRMSSQPIKQLSGIKIIKQQAIGSKERLMLIEVEGVKLLLGVSNSALNTLHVFADKASDPAKGMEA